MSGSAVKINERGFFKALQTAFVMSALLVISLYVMNALYSNASGDDFLYADTYIKQGFSGAQQHWYQEWNGRYFSTIFLTWLNPLSYHRYEIYHVVNVVLLLLLFFSLFYTAMHFARRAGLKSSVLLTCLFVIFFFINLTQIESGIFWIACSYVYIPGMVAFCGYLLLYFSYGFRESLRSPLLILLAFVIIGTNEMSMMSLLCFHGIKILHDLFFERRVRSNDLLLLSFSLLFSAVVFLCPGNQVRRDCFSAYADPGNPGLSLELACTALYKFFREKYFSIFLYSLLFVLLCEPDQPQKHAQKITLKAALLLLCVLAYIFVMSFASSYSTGLLIYGRTTNVIYFHFCMVLSLVLFMLRPYLPIPGLRFSSGLQTSLCMLVLVLMVLKSATIAHLAEDYFSGSSKMFSQECHSRYQTMEAASAKGQPALVSPHLHRPASLYLFDFDSINDYNLRCCERYYGIKLQLSR